MIKKSRGCLKIGRCALPVYIALLGGVGFSSFLYSNALAQPITSDSRIKTFVYNPNEVFTITTHYGYQSNIEFGPKETIGTISVGDRVGWQIIPSGSRLFIRAMEENAHTNMTIVTNMRAYQFDLRSSSAEAVFGSEELTYVVRFFYPQDPASNTTAAATGPSYVPPPVIAMTPPAPVVSASAAHSVSISRPSKNLAAPAFNYHYTFSGPTDMAPTKIYDDGKTTFFKLPPSAMPKISILTAKNESIEVSARVTQEGLTAVDAIAPRFSLNEAGRQVIVYNEANKQGH